MDTIDSSKDMHREEDASNYTVSKIPTPLKKVYVLVFILLTILIFGGFYWIFLQNSNRSLTNDSSSESAEQPLTAEITFQKLDKVNAFEVLAISSDDDSWLISYLSRGLVPLKDGKLADMARVAPNRDDQYIEQIVWTGTKWIFASREITARDDFTYPASLQSFDGDSYTDFTTEYEAVHQDCATNDIRKLVWNGTELIIFSGDFRLGKSEKSASCLATFDGSKFQDFSNSVFQNLDLVNNYIRDFSCTRSNCLMIVVNKNDDKVTFYIVSNNYQSLQLVPDSFNNFESRHVLHADILAANDESYLLGFNNISSDEEIPDQELYLLTNEGAVRVYQSPTLNESTGEDFMFEKAVWDSVRRKWYVSGFLHQRDSDILALAEVDEKGVFRIMKSDNLIIDDGGLIIDSMGVAKEGILIEYPISTNLYLIKFL